MPQTNIEKFNNITGLILTYLYDSYPKPATLSTDKFVIDFEHSDNMLLTSIRRGHERSFVAHTVDRLKEAGLLTSSELSKDCFYNAVLTVKGLECLNKLPKKLKPKSGKSFSEHLATLSTDAAQSILCQLSSGILTALAIQKIM